MTIWTLPYAHGKFLSQSKVGDCGGNSKLANKKVGGKILANQIWIYSGGNVCLLFKKSSIVITSSPCFDSSWHNTKLIDSACKIQNKSEMKDFQREIQWLKNALFFGCKETEWKSNWWNIFAKSWTTEVPYFISRWNWTWFFKTFTIFLSIKKCLA